MKPAKWTAVVLEHAPLGLFAGVLALFSLTAPNFLTLENLGNVGVQAAPAGIVAIGMTFVLLTAGVDLSVGAIMFVSAAVAGKLALSGHPFPMVMGTMLGIGAAGGALNALFITRAKLAPFIVTLAFLFVGRGFALWLTNTRAMNLPEVYLELGAYNLIGVPLPLAIFLGTALATHVILRRTPFGKRIYAVGHGSEAARKAGINVPRVLTAVYIISGLCAAGSAVLALGQLGSVSPKFGENYEFKAIAAAVLGGTSLLGGRGAVLPGTLLGVLLIQVVENGLVLLNADPYLYPLITSAIIFAAVLLDVARSRLKTKSNRRRIFV
ncbi:MAG: ABC transporter permease [Opitutaceae bacterium]|nr:ABC transporter permease [Opitutaceae bacterium]